MLDQEGNEQPEEEKEEEENKEEEEKTPIEDAKDILTNFQKVTEEYRQLVERAEKVKAENMLAGKSEAGAIAPKLSKSEIERKTINEILKGTGLSI